MWGIGRKDVRRRNQWMWGIRKKRCWEEESVNVGNREKEPLNVGNKEKSCWVKEPVNVGNREKSCWVKEPVNVGNREKRCCRRNQ